MATKAITIRVDEQVKEQAEEMLNDIGLTMSTYFVSSLKALIREKKVPFTLAASDFIPDEIILERLAESEREAADPNTKRLTHDDVFGKFREKLGYDI